MRKKILEKRLARLQAKKQTITERCNASNDVAEVRSLTAQLEEVNAEIAETQEELDAINEEEDEVHPAEYDRRVGQQLAQHDGHPPRRVTRVL